jgi:hypothetical protein
LRSSAGLCLFLEQGHAVLAVGRQQEFLRQLQFFHQGGVEKPGGRAVVDE